MTDRKRLRELAAGCIVLGIAVGLLPACSVRRPAAALVPVPAGVRLGGPPVADAAASTTAGVQHGLAVLRSTSASTNETFTVVAWLAASPDRRLFIIAGKYWEVADVVVTDGAGHVVFDEAPANAPLIRGGGPFLETIGGGTIYERRAEFKLAAPGRYRVSAVSRYRVGEQKKTGGPSDAELAEVSASTPPLTLTVR
jgi:hypothetical protein